MSLFDRDFIIPSTWLYHRLYMVQLSSALMHVRKLRYFITYFVTPVNNDPRAFQTCMAARIVPLMVTEVVTVLAR